MTLFKHRLTLDELFLILINMVPLYGVWLEGWSATQVFLVYCLETVIVGLVNVLKMIGVTLLTHESYEWNNNGVKTMQGGWMFIIFFIFHYGIFVLIQTGMFMAVSGMGTGMQMFNFGAISKLLGHEGKLMLAIFVTYYTLQSVFSFFGNGQYKEISMMRLMFQPYGRIFIQQVIVIFGSMFLSFGAGKIFMLIIFLVKTSADLLLNPEKILEKAEKKQLAKQKEKKEKANAPIIDSLND